MENNTKIHSAHDLHGTWLARFLILDGLKYENNRNCNVVTYNALVKLKRSKYTSRKKKNLEFKVLLLICVCGWEYV